MGSEEKAGHFSTGKRMGVTPETSATWDAEGGREVHVCALAPPPLPSLPAQLLATLLIQHERLRGVQSSGVLIIFWFLCVTCAIIPFRSKILSAMAEVRGKGHLPVSGMTSGLKVTAGSQAPPLHPSLAPRTSSELQSSLWWSLLGPMSAQD